jgi:hypothetical protein
MGNKVRTSPIMSNVHPMLNQVQGRRTMGLPTPRVPKNKVRTSPAQAQPAATPAEPTTGETNGN